MADVVVVVIEAGVPSGTLITARHAADLSKDLWAVPGPITSQASEGANRLISEGAKPLIDLVAFYEELGIKPRTTSSQHPLLKYLGTHELAVDSIIEQSGLPANQVEQELTTLELKGVIKRIGSGQVVRA